MYEVGRRRVGLDEAIAHDEAATLARSVKPEDAPCLSALGFKADDDVFVGGSGDRALKDSDTLVLDELAEQSKGRPNLGLEGCTGCQLALIGAIGHGQFARGSGANGELIAAVRAGHGKAQELTILMGHDAAEDAEWGIGNLPAAPVQLAGERGTFLLLHDERAGDVLAQTSGQRETAAHYQVLNEAGGVVVPTKTIGGDTPQLIANLETPRERGAYTLRLWLSDAEGNVGAPASVPLSYDCVRSDAGGGLALTAGLGRHADSLLVVQEKESATLNGKLSGSGGQIANAPLCVFSRVVTIKIVSSWALP